MARGSNGIELSEFGKQELLPLRSNDARGAPTSQRASREPKECGDHGGSQAAMPIQEQEGWFSRPGQMALDLLASIVFWTVLFYIPEDWFYIGLLVAVVLMVLMRLWRSCQRDDAGPKTPEEVLKATVPYTCGVAVVNGRELFLVATLHISPRAPEDVEAVINSTVPEVVMIELDEERLDRMRHDEVSKERAPRQEDLQPMVLSERGQEAPITVYAQRAFWNAEFEGKVISGDLVYNSSDPHGMAAEKAEDLVGNISLVQRGGADGQYAPFALKAFKAAQAGAQAVIVVNQAGELPINRIGGGSMSSDLRTMLHTWSCDFPPVPLLLLPHEDGTRLVEQLTSVESGAGLARAQFKVLPDEYPRRTLRKRICQGCALICSGIGILYGIIQCFAVEVGGEFLAAEITATKLRIPCVCIDVDLDRFWSRLGSAVLPTPQNIGQALLAWLAFPRVLLSLFFPHPGAVDVPGSMVLHAWSFPLRTWVAFILAGMCASCVTTHILMAFSAGAEKAAEGSGAVHVKNQEEAQGIQDYIMLGIEMYMMPRVYEAVAASRDEAMYQSIVSKCREYAANRMVVVVGAGHANGILQRVRTRGL